MNDFLRFPKLRRAATWSGLLAFVAALALIAYGIAVGTGSISTATQTGWQTAMAPVVAGIALLAWTFAVSCLIELSGKNESSAFRSYDSLMDIKAALDEQNRILRGLTEHAQLSDAARSIAHREREQAVLRQAINEDIIREDWEAAYYLVEQLERRFGYKLEAEQLRNQIDTSRSTLINRKIDESVDSIKNAIASHDWETAHRRAEQLVKHHPDHPRTRDLVAEIDSRRGEHKRRLLKEWDQAVQRDDVDNGIRILQELDQYLTPNEAEALKEAARDVFKAKLHNLGVQFSLAVTEGQWDRALQIGEQIISEFPNTRMATEVREKHDALQARAERNRLADAAAS